MRKILLALLFFTSFSGFAQLQEDFSDGNFTQNPTWASDAASFTINTAGQLQSNGPAVTTTILQLATPNQAFTGTTWEFYAKLNFATSSGNYADIFLTSDSVNFKGKNSGYFVRIGGTNDEVSLFRKDGLATPVYIINGQDSRVGGSSNNIVRIKVTRDLNSSWTLFVDVSGTGQNYISEGTALDATYQSSNYFGVLLRYSSANNKNFFFDDFRITDNTAPILSNVTRTGSKTLDVLFNEPVSINSAQQVNNYIVNNGIGKPTSATLDAINPKLVHLTFAADFAGGTSNISITNIEDIFGNRITVPLTATFSYTPPVIASYRDVRINEILADTDPSVGLPEAEFIELINASNKTFNLIGWKYSDATTATATLPAFSLAPNSYVILCRAADTAVFRPYGKVLGLSTFPTLNDGGDEVEIFDNTGKLIDKVKYTPASYGDVAKAQGGWSLELINPLTTCGNSDNYKASANPAGGTPGKENSVFNSASDTQPPTITKVELLSATQIKVYFSEALDSVVARNPANYIVSENSTVTTVAISRPEYKEVVLTLASPIQSRIKYTLTITNIKDCPGNILATEAIFNLALPEVAANGDVVINEILFNPRSGGVDFVELVNRSQKYIDLKNWQLGNIRTDSTSDLKTITTENYLLAPQQYIVLTSRPEIVQQHYPNSVKEAFLKMSSLPSFPDDAGTVRILNVTQQEIDRFNYDEKMHFKLLDDKNGVSLERIKLNGDSSATNWHSAATGVGYATPGYKNSQYLEAPEADKTFAIEPKIFTPDGDGDKDFTTISYQNNLTGNSITITIYDRNGNEIRRLVKNELLATNGFFQWDGLTEKGIKAGVGYYLILIQLVNPNGQVKVYKETVAVGAKF